MIAGRHLTTAFVVSSLAAARATAQEPPLGDRLAALEARLRALERVVERQAEELAEARRQVAAASPGRHPTAGGDAAAPRAAEVAPPPPAPPGEAPVEAPGERPVTHRLPALGVSGLVQSWYQAGNQGLADTFRIRRSELTLSGTLTDRARWQVMVDPAKSLGLDTTRAVVGARDVLTGAAVVQSGRILQNAVLTFDAAPRVQISVGQFKLPLSLEGQMSSGRLDTVERALFLSDRARGGVYGDVRDLGLMARGTLGPRIEYQAGVFNGVAESQNDVDRDDRKALAGSLVVRARPGLHLGASGAWGDAGPGGLRRDRLGGEVQVTTGPLVLRAELMTGHDGNLARHGWYGHAGYRFGPRLEGVVRIDSWDPDQTSESAPADVRERDYLAGLNVFLSGHRLKVQASFTRKTFGGDAAPSRNVLLIATQGFW